jgi:tetratricopeptide (TPR) repeat protein
MILVRPSEQTVSNSQFSPTDIPMKRFSNPISISIYEEIPDSIPYQVFLQILFRLPEANAKNVVAFRKSSSNEDVSYITRGRRMNFPFTDTELNLKMLDEMGIITDKTNDNENVHDFIEHYIPDFSIRYYTCESFIFTAISDAFQSSENLDYLLKSRMVITDLHNILKFKLRDIFLDKSTIKGPFYKAEVISRDKLHLLKQGIGKYITFQSFLSTTINEARALDFITKTDVDHRKQAIVLYAIEINNENGIQQLVQPSANVTRISCTSHEPEIMFSIGQIFKIRSMIQNETSRIWTIYLQILWTNETEHLNNLTNYYLSKIVHKEIFYNGIQAKVNDEPLTITTFVTIGDYYSSIIVKDYDKAEFYYQKFLKEDLQSPDDFDSQKQPSFYYRRVHYLYYLAQGYINTQLARIRYEQQKYVESAEYNKKAFEAYSKLNQPTLFAQVFNDWAKIYWKYNEQYDLATRHLLYALQMDRNNAEIFINIGLIEKSAEQYWHALNSFSTALSMIGILNETDYLAYGLIYREIGHIYEKSDQISRAVLEYSQAKRIYKKSVPSNHELQQQINEDIKRISRVTDNVHHDL